MFEKTRAVWESKSFDRQDYQLVSDVQDEFGRATLAEITEFEAGLTREERRGWVWVLLLALDMDSAMDILSQTMMRSAVNRAIEREMGEVEKFNAEVMEKWNDLQDAKRSIWKRIRKLRDKLKWAEQKAANDAYWLSHYKVQNSEMRKRIEDEQDELAQLRALKNALKEVCNA